MTDTFFEYLPKDLIDHLKNYTGPIKAHYLRWPSGTHYYNGRFVQDFERKYYVNKTTVQMNKLKEGKGPFCKVITCKIIFVNGKPCRLLPISKLYGIEKKRKHVETQSYRCKGYTIKGRRCKMKIIHPSELCPKHR